MVAIVCIMLWIRWFDCCISIAIALIILCILAACDLRVSVEASIFLSVFWLILCVSVVSLASIFPVRSFIAFVKSVFETRGEAAAVLLIA